MGYAPTWSGNPGRAIGCVWRAPGRLDARRSGHVFIFHDPQPLRSSLRARAQSFGVMRSACRHWSTGSDLDTGKSRDGCRTRQKDCCPRKGAPFAESDARGVRPVFELRAGGSNPKAVPRTAQSPGGLPPLEVDSTHRRLPVASDPLTSTFYGGNVPKGTGVMQSELRGSGATWPRSWTRPLGIRDAAVLHAT